MAKILIISSHIHKELASQQLHFCLNLVKDAGYHYQVEIISAGVYEIPFIVKAYENTQPFDAYIALGLILKANQDHYDYIMNHLGSCFSQFALNDIILGNGIVAGETLNALHTKIHSQDPCLSAYASAFTAVTCLLDIKKKLAAC